MIFNLSCAYFLDLIFGDPQWFPHPVRGIGYLVERGENFLRRAIRSEVFAGAFLTIFIVIFIFFLTHFVLVTLRAIFYPISIGVEIVLLYTCLSTRDLAVESRWVGKALTQGDLVLARQKCGWIVGRDTRNLNEQECVRATVETVAENTVDGVVAPLFFAVLGGAPLAFAYKTINTLDSMIGHKDEKYLFFGKFAAAIDRWANWVPARICGLLIPISAKILGFSILDSYKAAWISGRTSQNRNAAIPEGAMAGALQVRLGGENFYKGERVLTPLLGVPLRDLVPQRIEESIKVMYVTSVLALLLGISARFILEKFL